MPSFRTHVAEPVICTLLFGSNPPQHRSLCLPMGILCSASFLLIVGWHTVTSLCPSPSDSQDVLHRALDCLASSFSFLSLNCSSSDLLLFAFSGEASHTYFFRRKVSASRILQVPDALFLEFFQKLFAVCWAANKNFSWPKGEIIR